MVWRSSLTNLLTFLFHRNKIVWPGAGLILGFGMKFPMKNDKYFLMEVRYSSSSDMSRTNAFNCNLNSIGFRVGFDLF
ncbi:MAG: hypothetical protein K9G58_01500 [Bacteroidales bacterium]|nr:hypothetical protein [Bacteroidales bacterium]MCF8386347.1 hypothetical protein [Bacteroidales bacterium]MCF8396811.1 hypothetical protein [Bacteroidales bacterium]